MVGLVCVLFPTRLSQGQHIGALCGPFAKGHALDTPPRGCLDIFGQVLFTDRKLGALGKDLFGMQLALSPAGRVSVGPAVFCLPECRCVVEGRMLVAGFRFDPQGWHYEASVARVKECASTDVMSMLKLRDNFAVVLDTCNFFALPNGNNFLEHSISETTWLRWGLTANSNSEGNHIRQLTSALLDATPRVRSSTYGAWLDYLQSSS